MGERGILRIGGKQIEFVPNELNMRVLTNPEFCIVRVPSLPASRGVGHFFPMALDVAITTFDEVVMFREDVARAKFNGVARMSDGPVLRTDIDTRDGDCGFLLAGRVGNRWFLRAQHYLRWDSPMGHMAGAAIITQREIGAACERVGVVLQGIVLPASHLVRDGEGYFGPLPAKSEVGTAIARGAIARYVGELHPRPFGTTFTTNVKRTSMSKFFEDLERDWCGEVGYWRGPIFKGEMRGEHWWSPY